VSYIHHLNGRNGWLPKWSRSELVYGGLSFKIEHGKLVAILTLKKNNKMDRHGMNRSTR